MADSTLAQCLLGAPSSSAVSVVGLGTFSRGELAAIVSDVAARLRAAGVSPGATVSMAFENTIDFVVSFLAVTWARAVAAPLNAAYKVDEHHFYLEDGKAVLLLLPTQGNAAAQEAAAKLGVPVASVSIQQSGSSPAHALLTPMSGSTRFESPGSRQLSSGPLASDVALFLHTSGTTGRPKGVPLTHANLMASVNNIQATYEMVNTDVSYLVMPLFHVHGLMAGFLAPLAAQAQVVLPAAGKFTASTFWADCSKYRATFYTAVPTIHQVLLARASQDYPSENPPPLRFIRSCSSALAPATLERLENTFKVPVLEAYAMTEASHQMCSNPLPQKGPHKPGTVGTSQGGVQVAVLDGANRPVAPGQIGEVCVRGSNVTAGYLNNPKANEEAYAGGWFHTGDQGFLDGEGYLTLTGRIKELINRGGEKISPLEVDGVLLSHPSVAEAVCFGAPDEKYGEVVAAAVVLRPGVRTEGIEKDIIAHCAKKLAGFKVPIQIFVTNALPKTATGKIQRRHMVSAFMKPASSGSTPTPASTTPSPKHPPSSRAAPPSGSHPRTPSLTAPGTSVAGIGDGYEVVALSLKSLGVKLMFGVVGIPVTPLASAVQAAGIRFIGCRNEQAAGYAAAASGFLTGVPAAFLTVSGPGAVHGLAGVSHAAVNCWPMIMVSGSAEQDEIGRGGFQECDQVKTLAPYCKFAKQATSVASIPSLLAAAYAAAVEGRPGASYVDLPSNVMMTQSNQEVSSALKSLSPPERVRHSAPKAHITEAAELLKNAKSPLVVVGKGAALSQAEEALQVLVNRFGIPVLGTSMGRGLVPDTHPLCVNAARSVALRGADVVLVLGARLNWQLHFGATPRWSAGVKLILVDAAPPSPHDQQTASLCLVGDARVVVGQLVEELERVGGVRAEEAVGSWRKALQSKVKTSVDSLSRRITAAPEGPLDYHGVLGAVQQLLTQLHPAPIVCSEGANSMDMARLILGVKSPRTRLDAGTWGTMGVGLGHALAAATSCPGRLVVAVEGDSAFGFSGMEMETLVRYKLPVLVIVMNNGGIYGGDRRVSPLIEAAGKGAQEAGFASDPPPTSFAATNYDTLMQAFSGGSSFRVSTLTQLRAALQKAATLCLDPAGNRSVLLDVVLDPFAGEESGTVHQLNAPKAKL